MTTFQVEIQELNDLARRLQSIRDQLDVWDRRQGVMDHDFVAVGDARLRAVLEDFYAGWSDGAAAITSALDTAVRRLHTAAQQYRDSDNAVARAIPESTPPSTPGAP